MTKTDKLSLPPKPEAPNPNECCESGCERCVYVYYEEALQKWKEKVELILKERDSH